MGFFSTVSDFGKMINGTVSDISYNAGRKVIDRGMQEGISHASISGLSHAAAGATKYGIYGAAGLGIANGIYGGVSQDKTLVGGAISGAGLGAVGGAGAGVVAAAIAKSIR